MEKQKNNLINMFTEKEGVLRLLPTWVPRAFCRPGKRIKLHPDDYYALGLERGGIDERWLSSTTKADNGEGTPSDEGLSYIALNTDGSEKILLSEAVDILKGRLIGDAQYEKYGGWNMYSKFFDNMGPLPHHIHHSEEFAAKVGCKGKPEMYFFPSQLNCHGGEFPFTFFGLNPGVEKEEVKKVLADFKNGDNKILSLSRAYTLELDTGWDVPPGLLHAPGSLCTYEPQVASDVYAMYQSVLLDGQCVPESLLWKDSPPENKGDINYLFDVIDWELNTDNNLYTNRKMTPKPAEDPQKMKEDGYLDEWICYKCRHVSAKRLTVYPKQTVKIKDGAAYGLICLQGHGRFGKWQIESPAQIRYGQATNDEFFVSESAAKAGVVITNNSDSDNLVILKHFAENPDLIIEEL